MLFKEKYMKKKAEVTVLPVLRFAGKEVIGQPASFQGEKVIGNNQEISYRLGGNYVMRTTFPYDPDMIQSELYLAFDARKGKKTYRLEPLRSIFISLGKDKDSNKQLKPEFRVDNMWHTDYQHPTIKIEIDK